MKKNVIVNYQIHEKLYESSRSLVYRGYDKSTHQPAILKILKDEYPSPEKRARFQREYAITRKLGGNGVVEAFNLEKYQKTLVLLLEDFGGESLDNILKHRTLDVNVFLQLAISITEILEHIHQARIIHKDMNPSNIVWNPATNQLKLIDFGISSELPRETAQFVNVNSLEGTLAYLSPEQTGRMNRSLDYRTDFYSLGVTFYEMLSGHRPFETYDVLEMIHCHLARIPVPPCDLGGARGTVPLPLSDIIMKLLAKNAEDRYQSAFGLRKDLQRCLEFLESNGRIEAVTLGQDDMTDRFQIPEKLYGRTQEVNNLLQVFKRVCGGNSEIMLVTGEPGIGKSSLVYEIHKPITETQGHFITGKFDQFQQHIPYHALIQAFQEFVNYLLTEEEARLALWRERILQAVGNVGKVLTDVFPDLVLVIGPQPEIPQLAPAETQNRFNYVFENFVKAISQKEHPLVLFIDDMQWIDSASLNLLSILMSNQEIHYFLCIGAYRDNEVSPSHPLMMTLEDLKQAQAVINTITLPHLAPKHISHLISDALQSPEGIEELAEVVYGKTQGNAFFVKQLLYSLYEEEVLSFDAEKHCWQWDRAAIQQLSITDNVVDLMTSKVRRLQTPVQVLLKLAACIGNRFDLETLAVVAERSVQEIIHTLQYALVEGFIFPLGTASSVAGSDESPTFLEYKFSHDRIQEAAYSLIPEREKAAVHLNIGRLLHEKISKNQQNERIFDIVNHLNAGRTLIDHPEYILQLAELNLQAGRKAKSSTAYQLALRYFTIGTELLPETSWDNHHPLTFALHREWYECTYLSGHFDEAERGFMPILEHTTSMLEKAEMYNIRIVQYTMLGKYAEAFNMGWKALKLFGIELFEHDAQAAMQQEFEELRLNLGTKKIADLIHLPMMSHPVHKATLTLLINLIPIAYQNYPDVFRFIIARMVNITLKHGTTQESCFGLVAYGVILGADSGEYRTGYEFGKVGVQLSDTFKNSAQKCKPRHIFGRFINHWRMPIKSSVLVIRQALRYGVESGDVLNAGFTFDGLIQVLFSKGERLDRVFAEIENGLDFAKKTNNNLTRHSCNVWRQFVLNLQGHPRDSATFNDQDYHESQLLADIKKNLRLTYLFYILKLHSLYLYERYAEALSMARETEPALHYLSGELSVAEQNFYYSLTLSALYDTANEEEQRYYRGKLKTSQKQMKIWFDNCPENFQHKYLLIEAEIARIEGRKWDAVELYGQAIKDARNHEFIQHEALGNELLAMFWLAQDEEKIARIYMIEAHYGYQLWGANGKVKDLEKRYPHLLAGRSETIRASDRFRKTKPSTSTESLTVESLDLAAALKASQTLAGEIVIEKLLKTLMQIVMENAGAQKTFLLLEKNGTWHIKAEGRIGSPDVTVLQSLPVTFSGMDESFSTAIIHYVIRTAEHVLLQDASREGIFTHDSYVTTHHPKSILCLPLLNRGRLTGILYLENNLMAGAFTSERLEVLKLLSSPIAISIENAQLYTGLDQKVRERTQALEKSEQRAQALKSTAEAANQAKNDFLANMSHELRTPLNVILGYTQLLRRDESLTDKQHNAIETIHRSGDHLLAMITNLLDFSKIEVHKMDLAPTAFHLPTFLKSLMEIVRIRIQQRDISFEGDISSTLPTGVYGDEKCLRQVLINLLNNAITFTEQGTVTLRVECLHPSPPLQGGIVPSMKKKKSPLEGGRGVFRFEVRDTGIGIPPEHLQDIFLPFHQLGDARTGREGTGLGLAISQQLVRLMGSELRVNSVVGQGSTFWFEIPLPEIAEDLVSEATPSRRIVGFKGAKRTILLVDDQEENRAMLRDILAPLGFDLLEAVDGREAVRKAQESHPAVILMDLVMPVMDGFEATRQIRRLPALTGVIVIGISASAFDTTKQESFAAGCQDFLVKPIQLEELLECIRRYGGLEWIYEETAETDSTRPQPPEVSPLMVPPQDTVKELLGFAHGRYIVDLRRSIARVKDADPRFLPFAARLEHFADNFHFDQIIELLESSMQGKKQ